jgi:hypothetical protein
LVHGSASRKGSNESNEGSKSNISNGKGNSDGNGKELQLSRSLHAEFGNRAAPSA